MLTVPFILTLLPLALARPTPRSTSCKSTLPSPSLNGSYRPPTITLPSATPNPSISSSTYHTLTNVLPAVLQRGIEISNTSWELGTLSESLLEVYNPSLTPFAYDPSSFGGDVPWPMFSVALDAIASYNWTGSPSSSTSDHNLTDFLDPSATPVQLHPQPLLNGDGALGDPASLGSAIWVVAQFATRDDVRSQYGLRSADDYAWAVGNQLEYLRLGDSSANGTISQREGYFEVWSDMGGVLPVFPAYLGLTTCNYSLLNFGLTQWTLEASALIDPAVKIFRHINDFDARLWATGNGWMTWGAMRILESINSAGEDSQFLNTIVQVKTELSQVFAALFTQLDDNDLLPDYMLQSNATLAIGDASGTAAVVAAYYRFLAYCPEQVSDSMTSSASRAFDAVVGKIDSDGYLTQVVDPLGTNGWVVYPNSTLRSPEAQSFVGAMWAARTAAGC